MTSSNRRPQRPPHAVSAPARAMPAWIYNHPEMTRLELERILLPSWQMLCHVSQLSQAGDYVTLDLGTESVVGLRDRDGVIRAFHNVCRHRGARLLDGDGNCAGPDHLPIPRLVVPPRRCAAGCRGTDDLPRPRPVRARPAPGEGGRRVRLRLRRAGRRSAAGRQHVGRARRRARALSLRGHGAAHAHHDRDVERRLEDRDGQLPGVLPRARSGIQGCTACSRRTTRTRSASRRGARRELVSGAAVAALGGAQVPAARQPGHRPPA